MCAAEIAKPYIRYVNVSPADKKWGLYVPNAGMTHVQPGQRYLPDSDPIGDDFTWEQGRVLPDFQMAYITKGAGTLEYGSGAARSKRPQRRKITAGTVFIVYPGIWHRYKPYQRIGWDEQWITFNGNMAQQLYRNKLIDWRRPVYHVGIDEPLLTWFNEVLDLLRDEPAGNQPQAAGLTLQIIARLYAMSLRRLPQDRQAHDVIWQARRDLSENLDRTLDLHELADKLNLGYSWFRQLFRKQTGFSPHQFRLHARLQRAAVLLGGTTMPVKQIAGLTGFDCPFQFSRLFKKKQLFSPQAWRRRASGEMPAHKAATKTSKATTP